MQDIVDKDRIQFIKDMEFNDKCHTISRRLVQVHEEMTSQYDYIQYQKNEVERSKRDDSYPSEGLYPGYDNKVRISPVETVRVIKRCVGETNEYAIWTDDNVVNIKSEIISNCDRIDSRLPELNAERDSLEEKEQILVDIANVLEESVKLFEEMDRQRDMI